MLSKPAPNLGIALSGGTLKAAAHFGALVALEELAIVPDVVAGTSAGSFVATLVAHGYRTDEFKKLVKTFPGTSLLDYGFPISHSIVNLVKSKMRRHNELTVPKGLLKGEKLSSYFTETLKERKPKMPFYILATDLLSGQSIVFSNHSESIEKKIANPIENLSKTMLGSCALPGVFTPVQIKNWLLVDGAFRHYVPVQVLRRIGCRKVIAINLYRLKRDWRPNTVINVLTRSFDILLQETVDGDVQGTEIFVLSPDVSDVHSISLGKLDECWKLGYDTVKKNEQRLLEFLGTPADPRSARGANLRLATPKHTPPMIRISGQK